MKRRAPFSALAVLALIALFAVGAFLFFREGDSGSRLESTTVDWSQPDRGSEDHFGSQSVVSPGEADEAHGDLPAGITGQPVTNNQVGPLPVAKMTPRLQSSISELSSRQSNEGAAAAAEFAASHGLKLREGKVQVVIEAAPVPATSPTTAAATQAATQVAIAAGAIIETTHDGLIQAEVPVESLPQLAASSSISYIREPQRPTVFATSEGVADIGADTWQSAGDTGAGASIAVLDPGFYGYEQLVASGELPANVITGSFVAGGDITGGGVSHGSACAEIVHDVAPGAQLYLVNFSTDVELGNAVDYLITQGVDVVSASWGFYGSFRGDGQGDIDDMVQRANAAGITWANASGNAVQTHWSGHFTDANNDTWHEFATGDIGNDISASAGSSFDFYLTWDKWPLTNQDYDMYLFWSGNPTTAVAVGYSLQDGNQPPSEEIHYTVPNGKGGTYYVAIKNYSATGDATFQLYTYPGQLQYQVAAGSLGGQPTDSAYAMTVGAVPVGGTTIEYFSSRGPTIDGRIKPDISAPDRVSTVTYGNQEFWGTSAAAPHAAGAAALFKATNPAYTPAAVQAALESRATDLGIAGKDNTYGSGKLSLGALPDKTPPIVTGVQPAGTVYASSGTVAVYYLDSYSGVDTASVQVTIDGTALSGCAITAAQASCPFSGLSSGAHTIGGSVADNAGNASPISGSFNLVCGKPPISLGVLNTFWASFADYQARELSATFTISNGDINGAYNVVMAGSVNTNSALLITPVPLTVGDIGAPGGPADNVQVTVKYLVPMDVTAFKTIVYLTADDICGISYSYPSPYSSS
ncbi:MAG: S8 family serine peptidase [Thermoleophilia bacterium]|nr:S8 family serine peptidase [Thermoleophilia bacterium]